MSPYWHGVLTGSVGIIIVIAVGLVLAVNFLDSYGFVVRDDEDTAEWPGIDNVQTSTRVRWQGNAEFIDLDDRRGGTQEPETGRGA